MSTPELFVPFQYPDAAPPLREARSTLLVSGILTLKAHGLHGRYLDRVPQAMRDELLGLTAALWVPAPVVLAHYRAVDELDLPPSVADELGAELASRTQKTTLAAAAKVARGVGVTPWSALGQLHRIRDTTWRGTDMRVWKLGPKEARCDWVGQPCAAIPYFVTSFTGFVRSLIGVFCTKAYTRALPELSTATSLSLRIAWA